MWHQKPQISHQRASKRLRAHSGSTDAVAGHAVQLSEGPKQPSPASSVHDSELQLTWLQPQSPVTVVRKPVTDRDAPLVTPLVGGQVSQVLMPPQPENGGAVDDSYDTYVYVQARTWLNPGCKEAPELDQAMCIGTTATTNSPTTASATQHQHTTAPTAPVTLAEILQLLEKLQADYSAEMRLLLRACQVAGRVSRAAVAAAQGSSATAGGAAEAVAPRGGLMLSDQEVEPSHGVSTDSVRLQALLNCNDKHAAMAAAFADVRHAAAVAAESDASGGGVAAAVAAAMPGLRVAYHHELVAAMSAVFAICRGFHAMSTSQGTASSPIKAAMHTAEQQHHRVQAAWVELLQAVTAGSADIKPR